MARPLYDWLPIFRALRSSPLDVRPPLRARQRFCPPCLSRAQLEARLVLSGVTTIDVNSAATLATAITTANNDSSNSYVIATSGTITLESALPDLSGEITIRGQGAGTSTVERDPSASSAFGIFTVAQGANVTLSGLTIEGGDAGSGDGGGVDNLGTLTVRNSTFTGNSASNYGGGLANLGTATVSGSTFIHNSAAFYGGGLGNLGTATVSDSTFTGNSATDGGGGLANGGSVTVSGSTFTGNSAKSFSGGGIVNFLLSATATVSDSSFTGNSAAGVGGGLANFGTATVSDSTFTDNSASVHGGGIFTVDGTLIQGDGNTIKNNTPDDIFE